MKQLLPIIEAGPANLVLNLLNQYMGFVAVEPQEPAFAAIQQAFPHADPDQYNYVQLSAAGSAGD